MGGSSGGGKGSTLISSITNPGQLGKLFGNDSVDRVVDVLDPVGNAATQANKNTANWISGKEQFGSHTNWAGDGWGGDLMNPLFGAQTTAQREADAALDKTNREKWQAWSDKNGKANPYAVKDKSRISSLFGNDEDDGLLGD